MTNEKVKSAHDAEVAGVSSELQTTEGATSPGTPAEKVCRECGEPTIPKGSSRKFCDKCREGRAARKALEVRQKQKDSKSTASYRYASEVTPTKAEAKDILAERGLSQHLVDVCYDLAIYAAEQTGLIANRFFFANGVIKTQESYAAGKPVELEHIPSDEVPGELSNLAELKCVYDFSVAWREGTEDWCPSWEEFLRLRHLCKTDAFELSKLLDMDFEECCQGEWTKFFPRFTPDLKPNYSQKDMRHWLDSISPVKSYLLLASRNSMKSSFTLIWLATLHLCAPDARATLASETRRLSAGFMRGYRNLWEVQPHTKNKMHILFPEYVIQPGDGSQDSFSSPMAHLNLIAPSASATSFESSVVGGRCDVLIEDDPISNMTCGTQEQRQKSVDFHDLLEKTKEVLGSFTITVGTPWFADEDLYAVLIARNEKEGSNSLAVRIDPIVTLVPEARHKLTPGLLPTVTEHDVESFLLPVRMPWRFVRKEINANPAFALSQNFIVFPKESDTVSIIFEEDDLRNHLRRREFFAGSSAAQTVLVLDRATSLAVGADYTFLGCLKIMPVAAREGAKPKTSMVLWDCVLERLKENQIVDRIIDFSNLYHPIKMVAQKDRGNEADFDLAIRKRANIRGVPLPYIRWVPTNVGNVPLQKATRIKKLELPLGQDLLWFAQGPYDIDAVFEQFIKVGGGAWKKSSSRHDDVPDGISLAYEHFFPKMLTEPEDAKTRQQREDDAAEEYRRAALADHHSRMFSDYVPYQPTTRTQYEQQQRGGGFTPPPEPPAPAPIYRPQTRPGSFAVLGKNMRGWNPKK